MTAALTPSGKKIGRPLKPKDEVLGVAVSICMPRKFHNALRRAAKKAGCTRPDFVRMLLTDGFALWRENHPAPRRTPPRKRMIAAPNYPSATTEEHDATR